MSESNDKLYTVGIRLPYIPAESPRDAVKLFLDTLSVGGGHGIFEVREALAPHVSYEYDRREF